MATRDYQVSFEGATALPEDRYINVLYFADDNTVADRQRISDGIADAYSAHLLTKYSNDVKSAVIKVYPPGLNPGGPELETPYPLGGVGSPSPQEVAICLSYYATFNQPRTRGRIYLGPLSSSQMSSRPPLALMTSVIAFGEALAALGGWLQRSVTPVQDYKPITNIWVDDAWDTMRSRGLAPTTRSQAAV